MGASQGPGGVSELSVGFLLSPAPRAEPSRGAERAAAAAAGRARAHRSAPGDTGPLAAAGAGSTGKVTPSVSLLAPLRCCSKSRESAFTRS